MTPSCVGEEYPLVKPNWMGPSATMSVQRKAETWDSRRTAMEEVPAALRLDWRDPIPIRYPLPLLGSSGFCSAPSWSLPLSDAMLLAMAPVLAAQLAARFDLFRFLRVGLNGGRSRWQMGGGQRE